MDIETDVEDIARGVRAFTFGTAISRVLGLARESVFAYLFGAGRSTDAFNAAFRIPNLLRDLFAETALSAAFVPVLAGQKAKGKQAQNLFASNIFNTLFLGVGAITVIGIFLSPYLAKIIAFGFGSIPEKLDLTGRLTAIIFPFLLFVALAAWAMSLLNTEGEFFIPSLAPAFFNIFSIAVPFLLYSYYIRRGGDPIYGMAFGVTMGGFMQFLIQMPGVYRKGFRYRFYLGFKDPEFRKAMALFIPVAIGLAGSRINVAVNTLLVSFLEEGSMTWLNYAFRVMHLPLGLFGIAVGTVALPALSKFASQNDLKSIRETLWDSLKMSFFLTIPSSITIAFLSYPLTRVIFERGRFTAFDTSQTAQALILYILGIPFVSALRNVAAVFYAYRDAKTPMYASFASIGVNIVLNMALMRILGFLAFPLSTTIASFLNIAILFFWLPKKIGEIEMKPLVKYFSGLSLASGIGGGAAWALYRFLSSQLGSSLIIIFTIIVFCGFVSLSIFYFISLFLGFGEARSYLKRFIRP